MGGKKRDRKIMAIDSHEHRLHHHARHRIDKLSRLKFALILTAFGMLVEFAGGIFANSLALISDAWHMVTHLFALGMSYFAILLATRPTTKRQTYGFYRAEILAAFINGIILILISIYLVYEAVIRFVHPQEIKVVEMLFVAGFGLLINGASTFFLSRAGGHDLNIRSAILHEIGDLISSVAVVAAGVVIVWTNNYIIDPVLALFICVLIVIWAVRLLTESGSILLESTPKHLDIDDIADTLKSEIKGIHEVNHIHSWTIASSMYALTAHVVIEDCHVSKANEILVRINELVKKKYHIEHTNIQFECLIKK